MTHLQNLGATVVVHDPWVPAFKGDLHAVVAGCDALVLMVAHDAYRTLDLEELRSWLARPIMIDGRNLVFPEDARPAGWDYRGLGRRRQEV